jgi:hypothetical protein
MRKATKELISEKIEEVEEPYKFLTEADAKKTDLDSKNVQKKVSKERLATAKTFDYDQMQEYISRKLGLVK